MATYTNKNGTAGADVLTYNKTGTYHAGAGNDTIKITGGSGVVIYTDSGNNIINVTSGSNHTVKVAAVDADSDKQNGVERLTINGANEVGGYLGSGKDEITLANTDGRRSTGALSAIHGGGWTDTFTVNTGAQRYQLYGDAGDDFFYINNGSNIVCWGGAANDTFTVTGGTGIKLRGGDSADVYNISAAGVDMQLGYGNDVVNVTAGNNQTIKGNLGINTINLKGGSDHVITSDIDQAASKKVGHDVGYGVDKVNITGTATKVTAHLGDGKDEVTVSAGSGHNIYTEGWGDTITISGTVSNSYFNAGAGDDIIKISGGTNNLYDALDGNDNITISGGSDNGVSAGEGNNVINVTAGQKHQIYAGSGEDTVTISGGTGIKVCLENGDKKITLSGGANHVVETGFGMTAYGNDYINLEGSVKGSKITDRGGDNTIHIADCSGNIVETNKGADIVFIESPDAVNNKVNLGDGDNLVFLSAGISNTVTLGSGADAVFVATPMDKDSNNFISCGGGKDIIIFSGRGNRINTGLGDDEVLLSDCKNTFIELDNNDDKLLTDDNAELISVTVRGGNGNDEIRLGSATKLGQSNKIYGEGGLDYIQCNNNKYVLLDGGYDNDELYCYNITYGVIAGGNNNDKIVMSNVNNSFITGANLKDVYLSNDDKDTIQITGNANRNIIYGGSRTSNIEVTGSLQRSMIIGNAGDNTVTLSGTNCQYNRIYCGAGTGDVVNVKAGSNNNTIYGNTGYSIYSLYGGKNNLFEGGDAAEVYRVYDSCQDYNIVKGNDGRGYYFVNYQSKVIVDLTYKSNSYNPDNYFYLVGADINACNIKVDATNDIVKINDIYIKGARTGNYRHSVYDYTDSGNPGTLVLAYDIMKLKVGKTHSYADLSSELAQVSMDMGAMSYCVTPNDLATDLDKAYSGTSSFISQVVSTNTK